VFGQFDEGVRTIRQHLITDHTYWERIDEEIKNTHGHVSKNKNYWSIRDALGALSKTVYMLGKNAPHCVCPNCSGIDNECITCDGAGWLGERV